MIRQARPGEEVEIEAFLAGYADSSMFLRGNLAEHGLDERDHPHGTAFFRSPVTGPVKAMFGRTNKGFLMCQAPAAGLDLWQDFALAM
ncbi:hypothetical protein [Thalassovita aquimarina]|uniref:hypothetical protein n=1 Tax=Thalassovita aquimarina TaxID=2785917 RepID=UPI0035666195